MWKTLCNFLFGWRFRKQEFHATSISHFAVDKNPESGDGSLKCFSTSCRFFTLDDLGISSELHNPAIKKKWKTIISCHCFFTIWGRHRQIYLSMIWSSNDIRSNVSVLYKSRYLHHEQCSPVFVNFVWVLPLSHVSHLCNPLTDLILTEATAVIASMPPCCPWNAPVEIYSLQFPQRVTSLPKRKFLGALALSKMLHTGLHLFIMVIFLSWKTWLNILNKNNYFINWGFFFFNSLDVWKFGSQNLLGASQIHSLLARWATWQQS